MAMNAWTYAGEVTDRLAELREHGVTGFAAAWGRVMQENAPPWSWRGLLRPTFDDDEPPVEFLRRQCEEAWVGRAPARVELRTLLEGLGDYSSPAGARRAAIAPRET